MLTVMGMVLEGNVVVTWLGAGEKVFVTGLHGNDKGGFWE
jgi:hypothetical protein